LNKAIEEKTVKWKEEIKQQDDTDKNQQQEQQLIYIYSSLQTVFRG
jgi:hypothetical protein